MNDATQRAVDEGWCNPGVGRMSERPREASVIKPGGEACKAFGLGAELEREVMPRRGGVMVCARDSAAIVSVCHGLQKMGRWVLSRRPSDDRVVWELDIQQ